MSDRSRLEKRIARLVRCYPVAWRKRYGDEFTQLLLDDAAERPHSLGLVLDVLCGAFMARTARPRALLTPRTPGGRGGAQGAVVLAPALFVTVAAAVWSQLTVGWQWAAPSQPGTRAAMLLMSCSMAAFAVLLVLAAAPIVLAMSRTLLAGRARDLFTPLLVLTASVIVIVFGSKHFGHGWPGTGGHPWAERQLVPAAVARFCWAATLWISSYWAHPHALGRFPASELGWMIVCPLSLIAGARAIAQLVRRVELTPRLLRIETWLGAAAGVVMMVFLAGTASWLFAGQSTQRQLFQVGVIDVAGAALMTVALLVTFRVAVRLLTAHDRLAGASGGA